MLQRCSLALTVLILSGAGIAWTADYVGPRPPKPDMVYLVHADNLIPTETGEAKEEGKGNSTKYVMPGATSPGANPSGRTDFILQSDKLAAESLELYKFDVKGGRREVDLSGGRGSSKALHLAVTTAGSRPVPHRGRRGARQRRVCTVADGIRPRVLLPNLLARARPLASWCGRLFGEPAFFGLRRHPDGVSSYGRSSMPKKIDPLNKKNYGAVTAALTVSDIKAAVSFYTKPSVSPSAAIMNGPDRKPMHAELTLRGTTLMLGPENPQMGGRQPKTLGGSPVTLYLTTESADKMVAKAVKLGATVASPVGDMFWGDRCGTIVDPEGHYAG